MKIFIHLRYTREVVTERSGIALIVATLTEYRLHLLIERRVHKKKDSQEPRHYFSPTGVN